MAMKIGSARRKTRYTLQKDRNAKGKISISRYFKQFKVGDKVCLKAEPAVQKGMYFRRFHGMIGTITGRAGKNYTVEVSDQGKKKTQIVHPVHLREVKQ